MSNKKNLFAKNKKFKIFQKTPQEDPSFKHHKLNGEQLDTIWATLKTIQNLEQTDTWFCNFSELFLKSYSDWKPSQFTSLKKMESISQKLYEKDEAHPPKLIVETLKTLYHFTQIFTHDPNLLEKESSSLISIEMILLLSKSVYNQKCFIKYQLFQILIIISEQFNSKISLIFDEMQTKDETKPKNSFTLKLVHLLQYLLSRITSIISIFHRSILFPKLNSNELSIITQILFHFLLTLVQLKQKFRFNKEQYDILFDMIELFRKMTQKSILKNEHLLFLFKTITSLLEPPKPTVFFVEDHFKDENEENDTNSLSRHLFQHFLLKNQKLDEKELKLIDFQTKIVCIDLIRFIIKDNIEVEYLFCDSMPLTSFQKFITWVTHQFPNTETTNMRNEKKHSQKENNENNHDNTQDANALDKEESKEIENTQLKFSKEVPIISADEIKEEIEKPQIPLKFMNNLRMEQLFVSLKEICITSQKNRNAEQLKKLQIMQKKKSKSQNNQQSTKKQKQKQKKKKKKNEGFQLEDLLKREYQFAIEQNHQSANYSNLNFHFHHLLYNLFVERTSFRAKDQKMLNLYILNFFLDIFSEEFSDIFYKNQIWKVMILKVGEEDKILDKIIKKKLHDFFCYFQSLYPKQKSQISVLFEIMKENKENAYIIKDMTKLIIKLLRIDFGKISHELVEMDVFNFYLETNLQLLKMKSVEQFQAAFNAKSVSSEIYYKLQYKIFKVLDYLFANEEICIRSLSNTSWGISIISLVFEKSTKKLSLSIMFRMMCSVKSTATADMEGWFFQMYMELVMTISQRYTSKPLEYSITPKEVVQTNSIDDSKNTIKIPSTLPEYPIVYIQELLSLATEAISINRESLQKLLPQIGIFEMLISLMSIPELNTIVSRFILRMLNELLYCSKINVDRFNKISGFKNLGNLLLDSQQNNSDVEIFQLLLSMIVNTGKFDKENNYLIQNYYLVSMMFELYYKLEDHSFFSQLLDIFCEICEKSTQNISFCYTARLLEHLSTAVCTIHEDLILQKVSRLIKIICSYGITIEDMHTLFRPLAKLQENKKLPYLVFLFRILHGMVEKSEHLDQPLGFFDFHFGHLSLPNVEKWPNNGWGFYTWMRFERETINSTVSLDMQPRIFSFFDDSGKGIEFFFLVKDSQKTQKQSQDNKKKDLTIIFVLRVLTPTDSAEVAFPFDFPQKQWNFVAVSQSPIKGYSSSSKVRVYLNFEMAEQAFSKYLTVPDLTKNKVGSRSFFETPFPNSYGPKMNFYLPKIKNPISGENEDFSETKPKRKSKAKHDNSSPQTDSKIQGKSDEGNKQEKSGGWDQKERLKQLTPTNSLESYSIPQELGHQNQIYQKMEWDYSFVGEMGIVCFFKKSMENSHFSRICKSGPQFIPFFDVSGVTVPVTTDPYIQFVIELNQSILLAYHPKATKKHYCLDLSPGSTKKSSAIMSGVASLFFYDLKGLITSLGGISIFFPFFIDFEQLFPNFRDSIFSSEEIEITHLDYIFSIFADILCSTKEMQDSFVEEYSFALISKMIGDVDPLFISKKIVSVILKMLLQARSTKFANDLFFNLVLSIDNWIYCSFEIHKGLLGIMTNVIKQDLDNEMLKEIDVSIQMLIDILTFFYWLKPEEFSRGTEPKFFPKTNRYTNRELSSKEVTELRSMILILIYSKLSKLRTENTENNRKQIKESLLLVIYSFCILQHKEAYFGELGMFVGFLLQESKTNSKLPQAPILDTALINPLVFLLDTHESPSRRKLLEFIYDLDTLGLQISEINSKFDPKRGYIIVNEILLKYELTKDLSHFLFQIMVSPSIPAPKVGNDFEIQRPWVFFTILKFIKKDQNSEALLFANKVLDIIKKQNKNPKGLLDAFGWQFRLIELVDFDNVVEREQIFYRKRTTSEETEDEVSAKKNEANDFVFDFFRWILSYNLLNHKTGLQFLLQTIAFVGLSTISKHKYEEIVVRRILFDVFQEIAPNIKDLTKKSNTFIFNNIYGLVEVVRRYFYFDFSYEIVKLDTPTNEMPVKKSSEPSAEEEKRERIKVKCRTKHTHIDDFMLISGAMDFFEKSNFWIKFALSLDDKKKMQVFTRNLIILIVHFLPSLDSHICHFYIDQLNILINLKMDDKILIDIIAILFQYLRLYSNIALPENTETNLERPSFTEEDTDQTQKFNEDDPKKSEEFFEIDLGSDNENYNDNDNDNDNSNSNPNQAYDMLSSESTTETDRRNESMHDISTGNIFLDFVSGETRKEIFWLLVSIFENHYSILRPIILDEENKVIMSELFSKTHGKELNGNDIITEETFHTKKWRFAWRKYFLPRILRMKKKNIASLGHINKQIAIYLQSSRVKLYEENVQIFQQKKIHHRVVIGRTEKRLSKIRERMKFLQVLENRKNRSMIKKRKRAFRQLISNKFLWYQVLPKSKEYFRYFKLDKTEDLSKTRPKMRINYNYDSHFDALMYMNKKKFEKKVKTREEKEEKEEEEKKEKEIEIENENEKEIEIENENQNQNKNNENQKIISKKEKDSENKIKTVNDFEIYELEFYRSGKKNQDNILKEVLENMNKAINTLAVECEMISGLFKYSGILEITEMEMNFYIDFKDSGNKMHIPMNDKKWKLKNIIEVHRKRHNFQPGSLEIEFDNHKSYFFKFSFENSNAVFQKLSDSKLTRFNRDPDLVEELRNLTKQWQNYQLSNFDYLLKLNFISGRTFNDLSQYPVFPWIFSDYECEELDLKNPEVYRDLSKPIGALNPKRLKIYSERYTNMIENTDGLPPFYYGSHYSSPASVVFYLIRLEPFTTQCIYLHGGKFDHPDRLFHSIPLTWRSCLSNSADLKELTPEFFYFPEFLLNQNNFNFGIQHTNQKVEDVELPKWAKSPEDFVRINRKGLESEHVSETIHMWIDLIFGYKQRGEEAIKAHNVFYFLTYDNIDFDSITNKEELNTTFSQIENFGQTPKQIFFKPHPQRIKKVTTETKKPIPIQEIFNTISIFSATLSDHSIVYVYLSHQTTELAWFGMLQKLYLIDSKRNFFVKKWALSKSNTQQAPVVNLESEKSAKNSKMIGTVFAEGVNYYNCFSIASSGDLLFSCGFWDNSFIVSNSENGVLVNRIVHHKDVVTCIKTESNRLLATGSRDCTVVVWDYDLEKRPLEIIPRYTLSGHRSEVTAVAMSSVWGMLVTGAKDGVCIIYSLYSGSFFKKFKIRNPSKVLFVPGTEHNNVEISMIRILSNGQILVYSINDPLLSLYSHLGRFISNIPLSSPITSWEFIHDEEFLITGSRNGLLQIFNIPNLSLVHDYNIQTPICYICITPDKDNFLIGGTKGALLIGNLVSSDEIKNLN